MQVTPAMDESEKERLAGPEADEEEKKKLRRQRAEEWKRKRAKVKELGQNT